MDCEAAEDAGGRLGRDPVIEWTNNCILRRAAAGAPCGGERAADSRTGGWPRKPPPVDAARMAKSPALAR
ncbi:hypothetical protein CBM2634_A230204 [Cupriavidus taiwanensis]|uniref:Uncharacterized protein n=1 Tax=Cupriavidus taiwanensis TaxID=164546 RepID=A0A375IYV0_9BURK|nr:hypothetical protein CBM2634_A230204 [Cupriavidus taiwanensis]